MKLNPFALLLISGIVFLSTLTFAQENNYITSRYDFIPGEKVIFFDDFTSESIGDFPAHWLTNGSGEIVTSDKFPGKWFNLTKMGYFIPEAKEDFTEYFTVEFDFVPITTDVNKAKNRRVEFINIKEKTATPTVPAKIKGTVSATSPSNSPSDQEAGLFKDPRDGKTYKTVKIDTQTWMADNLAYKTAEGCWSYENKESNLETYGYLYNWETAIKACPSGWHLPSQTEFETLFNSVGGDTLAADKLKEKGSDHWLKPNTGATDELGFKALPGGARSKEGQFQLIGYYGFYWSSTENDSSGSWILTMYNSDVNKAKLEVNLKANSFSVRCVKD